ncbi:PorP/SprF family type IX secretion system membrane protein [Fulvivirgaceae bacterium PWU4]|uniref:PorP/SprF family type IX secretion system membrane protein n=1 Tax=Chryseosolibacter histidini TaxID=2782349 RepID=A0AAP2DLJ8_9BACT|nr:PorP/SprF family type IX secretion system membrane protein [Chryseosolibacter histidini]MBT1696164.1 PorP/SprF family type IX secretion system membrane protein [Chryseosolibacter histidini]
MMARSIILACLVMTAEWACGQYFQYSQYNFASQRINPAIVASSSYASLGLLYRQQATGGDVDLKSSFVSAVYPMLNRRTGQRWAGIGVTAMDDRADAIFKTQEASLSYALNIPLSRFTTLSLGMKGLYLQRRINLDGLYTGEQFISDRGFDRSIANGENLHYLRSDFFTFSTGMYWQQTDRAGDRVAYFGLSLFDFNRPDDSFAGVQSQLSSTMVFNGGVRIYHDGQLSFSPELLFTRSASNNVINMGAVTSYVVNPTAKVQYVRIDILTKYVAGRSGILGLQWHSENFSIGCSYDFPVGQKNAGNTSAFEVGLELRKLVDHKFKRKVIARKKNQPVPNRARAGTSTTAKKTVATKITPPGSRATAALSGVQAEYKADSAISTPSQKVQADIKTTLRHKQDSVLTHAEAGAVDHEPFVVEKVTLHFNFEFNSSDLDEPSGQYLDELAEALAENEHLRIRLTGHTDNIGSAKFNQRLSLFRANTIKQYLVEKGLDPERVETEGKGLTEPLNENKTDEERARNRRVELTILYED